MNSTSHSLSCDYHLRGFIIPEWRTNFFTREMFVAALISVTVVNLLVSPLTIFLNILVVLAVKTTLQLRNKSNVLLACLAGTYIISGAVGQPLFIAELIYRLNGSPASEFCRIPYAARSFIRTSLMSSLLHLTFISIERYMSITFPFKYHDIVTKRRLSVSIVLVWSLVFLAIFFSIYKLSLLNFYFHALVIFLAIFIISFCRICSYHEARKRIGNITTQSAKAKFLKEKKALKTTSFVIGVVLLCFIPMTVFTIVSAFHIISPDSLLAIESCTLTLVLCNSVFYPVIHCTRSRGYRRAFKKLLRRVNYVQAV